MAVIELLSANVACKRREFHYLYVDWQRAKDMLRGDGRYVDYGRQADNNQGQSMLTAGDGFQILLESLLHPYVDTQKHSQVNEDPLVGLLGETTNVILYSIFRTNLGREFSRSDLREMVDERKRSAAETKGFDSAAKIQSGKLAVDYWIDFFVDRKVIEKRNSNPVMFKMVSDRIPGVSLEGGESNSKPKIAA